MKKIPTLFKREYDGHKIVCVLPEPTPGLEWILNDPGVIPTIKIDGSCCMIDKTGNFWKRYDAKPGRMIPQGAIPCQDPDPITGHWPHWVPVQADNPADRWYMNAFLNTSWPTMKAQPGTYEAIGPHFQGNPYELQNDYLVCHGEEVIKDLRMSFAGIKEWLCGHYEEGIVFWYDGEPICKIKRSDFGMPWGTLKGGFTHA